MKITRYLWINDLPKYCDDQDIHKTFQSQGKIQKIRIHESSKYRGAVVSFIDCKSSTKAFENVKTMANKPLKLEYCEANGEPGINKLGISNAYSKSTTSGSNKTSDSQSRSTSSSSDSSSFGSSLDDYSKYPPYQSRKTLDNSSDTTSTSKSSLSKHSSISKHSSGKSSSIMLRKSLNPDQRGLLVNNLSQRSSDTSLREGLFHEFKRHGKITSVTVLGQGVDRHAIISFLRNEDMEKALLVGQSKTFFGTKLRLEPHQGHKYIDPDLCPPELATDEYHPKSTKTLFVGKLSSNSVSHRDLRRIFKKYGEIIDIDVKAQTNATDSSFAFVQYYDIASVVRALSDHDSIKVDGQTVKLGFGKSQPSSTIWVGNLARNYDDSALRRHFNRFGSVVRVVCDAEHRCALVQFEGLEEACRAFADAKEGAGSRRMPVDYASNEYQTAFVDRMRDACPMDGQELLRTITDPYQTEKLQDLLMTCTKYLGLLDNSYPRDYDYNYEEDSPSTRRSSYHQTQCKSSYGHEDYDPSDEYNHTKSRRHYYDEYSSSRSPGRYSRISRDRYDRSERRRSNDHSSSSNYHFRYRYSPSPSPGSRDYYEDRDRFSRPRKPLTTRECRPELTNNFSKPVQPSVKSIVANNVPNKVAVASVVQSVDTLSKLEQERAKLLAELSLLTEDATDSSDTSDVDTSVDKEASIATPVATSVNSPEIIEATTSEHISPPIDEPSPPVNQATSEPSESINVARKESASDSDVDHFSVTDQDVEKRIRELDEKMSKSEQTVRTLDYSKFRIRKKKSESGTSNPVTADPSTNATNSASFFDIGYSSTNRESGSTTSEFIQTMLNQTKSKNYHLLAESTTSGPCTMLPFRTVDLGASDIERRSLFAKFGLSTDGASRASISPTTKSTHRRPSTILTPPSKPPDRPTKVLPKNRSSQDLLSSTELKPPVLKSTSTSDLKRLIKSEPNNLDSKPSTKKFRYDNCVTLDDSLFRFGPTKPAKKPKKPEKKSVQTKSSDQTSDPTFSAEKSDGKAMKKIKKIEPKLSDTKPSKLTVKPGKRKAKLSKVDRQKKTVKRNKGKEKYDSGSSEGADGLNSDDFDDEEGDGLRGERRNYRTNSLNGELKERNIFDRKVLSRLGLEIREGSVDDSGNVDFKESTSEKDRRYLSSSNDDRVEDTAELSLNIIEEVVFDDHHHNYQMIEEVVDDVNSASQILLTMKSCPYTDSDPEHHVQSVAEHLISLAHNTTIQRNHQQEADPVISTRQLVDGLPSKIEPHLGANPSTDEVVKENSLNSDAQLDVMMEAFVQRSNSSICSAPDVSINTSPCGDVTINDIIKTITRHCSSRTPSDPGKEKKSASLPSATNNTKIPLNGLTKLQSQMLPPPNKLLTQTSLNYSNSDSVTVRPPHNLFSYLTQSNSVLPDDIRCNFSTCANRVTSAASVVSSAQSLMSTNGFVSTYSSTAPSILFRPLNVYLPKFEEKDDWLKQNSQSEWDYPIRWTGKLCLKNDEVFIQMHLLSGNDSLLRDSMNLVSAGHPLSRHLKIGQRMRLEPTQLEGLQRRLSRSTEYCTCLTLAGGDKCDELARRSATLDENFIKYLQAKSAAGIINIPGPDSHQNAYVINIFPPCQFSDHQLKCVSQSLYESLKKNSVPYLVIVITSA